MDYGWSLERMKSGEIVFQYLCRFLSCRLLRPYTFSALVGCPHCWDTQSTVASSSSSSSVSLYAFTAERGMSWEGCWALGLFSHTAALTISLPFPRNLQQHLSKTNPRMSLGAVYPLGGSIIKSTPSLVPSALPISPSVSTPYPRSCWGGGQPAPSLLFLDVLQALWTRRKTL